MKLKEIILIILLPLSISSSSHSLMSDAAAAAPTNSSDMATLLTFKSMVSDPHNALSSWGNTTLLHFCGWRGVTCGGRAHPDRVTGLTLDSLDLAGALPPHIANLTFLRRLRLPNNSFTGGIPHELGGLSRLTRLNLSRNYLDGEIPATLTRCSNLQVIDLLINDLSGEIPTGIGSLSQLLILNLGLNNLTGTIPSSLGNISSLLALSLRDNDLVGSIPASLGKLSGLQILQLYNNNLSSNIPPSLFNLSSMGSLGLAYNRLTGTLPPDMFNTLPNLQSLYLSSNLVEGHIPSSLSNATNMGDLELESNRFTGTIPPNLGNLQYLYWVGLADNQLEAKEPSDWDFLTFLTNCSYLEVLDISSNNLGSMLPSSVANLSSTLQYLMMNYNQFAGIMPNGIGNLGNLTVFTLGDNLLTGSIPAAIGKLQQLHSLSLGRNRFTGPIPYTIGNLTQLNRLYLQGNNLNGSIPAGLGKCQSLQELDLSQNMLTDNKLSGEIPTTLGDCRSLEYLHIQSNLFDGAIPQSLSELKGLRELDLSQNNLSGDVPKYMGSLAGLQYLNLSYNNLEGEVPDEGILANATKVSILGNMNLCGGSPKLHLPACHTQIPKKRHMSLLLKVIIPVLGACLCLILLLVVSVARHRLKNQQSKSQFTSPIDGQFIKVSYAELLKATDGFSPSNLIGVGSVGSVYKGILKLDENTCVVAVKVLNLQQRGASKSFVAECDVLRSIRHRNLLKILTSCSSIDFSGNEFKALVLEFMLNGSLDQWLHPVASEHSSMTLSLVERLNIATDVASALEYLHHHGETPIVHCDLKPSNILLDASMCAHVGDFGLAKFIWESLPEPDEHKTSIGLKGTIGYVAPEYGMGGLASTYGDVYSFGILLLELFTGKRPTDEMFKDGLSLRNYAEMALPERVMDIVDSEMHLLENDIETGDNNQNENDARVQETGCLASIIRIGLSCSNQDPRERMEMEDITKELRALKEVLLRFKIQEG